jgi:prepilin-type processing-associated H-X9-DG protein
MIAIGDGSGWPMAGWSPYDLVKQTFSHGEKMNATFCDGHVEGQRSAVWFSPAPEMRSRWNFDHQPHDPF